MRLVPRTHSSATSFLKKNSKDQKGQTFLEFILLLMILVSISFGFMRGFNYYIGTKWNVMLKIIARPNSSSVTIP